MITFCDMVVLIMTDWADSRKDPHIKILYDLKLDVHILALSADAQIAL